MATYNIRSLNGLWKARYADRETMNGTYNLRCDIDMSKDPGGIWELDEALELQYTEFPDKWIAMGNYTWDEGGAGEIEEYPWFTGTFNGNGHKILNMSMGQIGDDGTSWSGQDLAFFYNLGDAPNNLLANISNLTLENVTLIGNSDLGGFAAFIEHAIVTNCHVKNISIIWDELTGWATGANGIGGFAGWIGSNNVNKVQIVDCTVDGMTCFAKGSYMGGFAGWVINRYGELSNDSYIQNCSAINISFSSVLEGHPSEESDHIGGFAGFLTLDTDKCYCEATISIDDEDAAECIGGFAGDIQQDDYVTKSAEITNCYCDSQISLQISDMDYATWWIAGFVGLCSTGGVIDKCYAYGSMTLNISSELYAMGGFCGQFSGSSLAETQIKNSYSVIDMSIIGPNDLSYIGGFIGWCDTKSGTQTINRVYSSISPQIVNNSYWVGGLPGESGFETIEAIGYGRNTYCYPVYLTSYAYTSGIILDSSSTYITTTSFTSTTKNADIAAGNIVLYETPNPYSYFSLSSLEDNNFGTDESTASNLAHIEHVVYTDWDIVPIDGSTGNYWYEQYWLDYIYPTFVYPGPIPQPEPPETEEPINFYERW